jgi:hypothetical protein
MKTAILSWWPVARGSWWIQCRSPRLSAYMRTLKSVRRVSYAVLGDHLTIWAFDGTERKLRAIIRGLAEQGYSVSGENQQEPLEAVFFP